MTKRVVNVVIRGLALALALSGTSRAADAPIGTFSLGDVKIGVSSMNDVQSVFGPAQGVRVSHEDEADKIVCYTNRGKKGPSFLLFETGPMGAFTTITGFRLSKAPHAKNCASTKVDIASLRTDNGAHLGQSTADFKKVVAVNFDINGSELTFESESKRAATQEEVKRIRANWPDANDEQFDVTTIIKGKQILMVRSWTYMCTALSHTNEHPLPVARRSTARAKGRGPLNPVGSGEGRSILMVLCGR